MTQVILKDVRLSYPDIWKPGDPKTDKTTGAIIPGKFGAQGIFAPSSAAADLAKKAFLEVATAKWGQNATNVIRTLDKDKKCIRQGNDNLDNRGAIRDGYQDMLFISARSKSRPAIVAHKFMNGKPVIIGEDGSAWQDGHQVNPTFEIIAPYGGCYVNLKVDIYAMDKQGQGKSINATLQAVQFFRHGAAFGQAPGTAEGFEGDDSDDGVSGPSGMDNLFADEDAEFNPF